MIQLLISMGGNTLRKEMYDWFYYASDTATVSAFVQQRNKLLPAAFESIFHRFTKECTINSYYSGYRVLAIDGSDLRLPANANDPETYIKTNETDKKGIILHTWMLYMTCSAMFIATHPCKYRWLPQIRWGIETSFRELKYTIGLASIHSKKIQFVIQEVFSKLILYNFPSLLMSFRDLKDNKVRINFSAAFLWCKQFLYNMTSEAVLLQMLLRCTSSVRTGRNFPRYQEHFSAMSLNYRII